MPLEPTHRRYHHGSLRSDLVRIAHEQVAAHGAENLSMASLARLAGVAQSAPYRHFADRRSLLEAVATEGFGTLNAMLQEAVRASAAPLAVNVLAAPYFMFGQSNIALYRLMFASRLTQEAADGSQLGQAAGEAFALLRQAVMADAMRQSRTFEEKDVFRAWGAMHGLVMLKADGFINSDLTSFLLL